MWSSPYTNDWVVMRDATAGVEKTQCKIGRLHQQMQAVDSKSANEAKCRLAVNTVASMIVTGEYRGLQSAVMNFGHCEEDKTTMRTIAKSVLAEVAEMSDADGSKPDGAEAAAWNRHGLVFDKVIWSKVGVLDRFTMVYAASNSLFSAVRAVPASVLEVRKMSSRWRRKRTENLNKYF